ncbi:hypothetical protein Tco_0871600 [Tanacetum coccineum]
MDTAESSAPKRSTVIRFRLPEKRSTRLTLPAPVPIVDKVDEMILQDTLQISLAEHKSREEQEAKENVELVNKHLASEEIEKMMEGSENVIDDSLPLRNDEPKISGTRLEPKSDKESPEVESTNDEEVEITNVVIPVNEEDDEITDEVYELKRREKGKIVEESRSTPFPTPIRPPRTYTKLVYLDTEKLQELTVTDTQTTSSSRSQHTKLSKANRLLSLFKAKPARFKRYKNFFQELQGRYTYLFEHLKERFLSRKSFDTLADHLQEVMVESLPIMVDTYIKEQVKKQVPEQVRDKVLVYVAEGLIMERQKTKEEMERMIAKAILQERGNIQAEISSQIQKAIDNHIPSQVDASMKFENHQVRQTTCRPSTVRPRDQDDPHDDAHPEGENIEKRQNTSEYEAYQEDDYDFWTDSYASNDDDNEERTSRRVNKCVKKFNPYARYGVEHWKNPHAKIFYIRKQKEPGKPKEEPDYKNLNKKDIKDMYLLIMNGKVPDYAKTRLLWSLSIFIRILVIWERVHNFQLGIESYQQKVNLTALTISFPGVEKHKMFSIIYEPVHGIIYKNSKKEKRVTRHSEIHKFCDGTLNRVLEGLKSYNNDVKYGYVQRELTNDEVEYLKLFEEEIEVRLKYRNQMRRWEMYVNGRPLGPRRERPE